MLKLRLQRRGKKNYATFRVVVADQHAPVKGRFIADVGWYNPHTNEFKVEGEAITKWLSQGVQPSDTVHNLLVTHGLLKADKVTIWRVPAKEAAAEEAAEKPAVAESTETPATPPETPAEPTPAA
jgi:small subunit ribosomal protein S16